MNKNFLEDSSRLIGESYTKQGSQILLTQQNVFSNLLKHRKIPDEGWNNQIIENFLFYLSSMDGNNFIDGSGVGEREGRVASSLVMKRHYYFSHGIGRSGDIAAVQPKAAGSSLLSKIANSLVLDAINISGIVSAKERCWFFHKSTMGIFNRTSYKYTRYLIYTIFNHQSALVIPMATGMSLTLCLLSLRSQRPTAKFVIWPRIDQKSAFKCILTAGFIPIIINGVLNGDCVETNIDLIQDAIEVNRADSILCILSTTSCFAPRHPDKLEDIGKVAKKFDIPHIVNNAYGLQSSKCCHLIETVGRKGGIDLFVQSLDKNFLIPVGGAVVAGFDKTKIENVGKTYAGRGSSSPSMDLMITLLSLGKSGYKKLLETRKALFITIKESLNKIASDFDQKILLTKENQISLGMTLNVSRAQNYTTFNGDSDDIKKTPSFIGSQLFLRHVSGARVVECNGIDDNNVNDKNICGYIFKNWGSHCDDYFEITSAYITFAAAIGATVEEYKLTEGKLIKILDKYFSNDLPKEKEESSIGLDETEQNS